MEYTTKDRRDLTKSILTQQTASENITKFKDVINVGYGVKVEEDASNRFIFHQINSQFTGYAYEYALSSGVYHPMLEIKEYSYKTANDDLTVFTDKTYWDSPKLQEACKLEQVTDFFTNLNESHTDYLPIHADKYSSWADDADCEEWTPTEQELFDAIRNMITYYGSGGTSASTSGANEIMASGDYSEFVPGDADASQPYMTVNLIEYVVGEGGYMDDAYDPIGDLILINGTDLNNFSYGKIIGTRMEPARILYAPFCTVGTIPAYAEMTSDYTASSSIILEVIHGMIDRLQEMYENIQRYLSYNPNENDADNQPIITSLSIVLGLITTWKDGGMVFSDISGLIDSIETDRSAIWSSRETYISTILGTGEIFDDLWNVLDMRMTKRMGSLRDIMMNEQGAQITFDIAAEKAGSVEWLKKFFIVRKCEQDGDWKRRVFIVDENDEFQVGDEVYLLSDNEDVPEIRATIDIIVDARLVDTTASTYDSETGDYVKSYYNVKKIFFKDAWKDGKVRLKRFFPDTYSTQESFRIIKQIT